MKGLNVARDDRPYQSSFAAVPFNLNSFISLQGQMSISAYLGR